MKGLIAIFVGLIAWPLLGQSNSGELLLKVTDPAGLGLKTSVQIVSKANHYRNNLDTGEQGNLDVRRLPYGIYQIEIAHPGFVPVSESVEIHSSIPTDWTIRLRVSSVSESLTVTAPNTLIDPDRAGAMSEVGADVIENRVSSIPGRSLQDLVNTQPGWLYEGNAVLHPRGSEYQTQFVIDGIPLVDNRSPSFGPTMEVDDAQSLSIYTAGIPAEYGRKMGGVIEVNTLQDPQPGFHGQIVLSGGSFVSAGAFAEGQYVWGKNVVGATASGSRTDHYLNPVVPENYTNRGTSGDFSVHYERDLSSKDRLRLSVRHEVSRYQIPNEQLQESAGQRQAADNFETMGIASYQHTFSQNAVADFRGMVRDNANGFNSNPNSTPIGVFQRNSFREGYFKATSTIDEGRNEWKFGIESDNNFLHENFDYHITDASRFSGTPPLDLAFAGSRPDLEQSAFVQDRIRLKNWTISAGLRWDHYQLFLNRHAFDPRLSASRYFKSAGLLLHFSYDRVFQTPSFENMLLSNSLTFGSLDPTLPRLPVKPSEGNYYEGGVTKSFREKLKVDVNYFRRLVNNYADDKQISNTTVSFPIAFSHSVIYGVEEKLELPDWHRFSGFLSHSYQVGNVWFPVAGGLFLEGDAGSTLTGHFPDIAVSALITPFHGGAELLRESLINACGSPAECSNHSGLPFEVNGDPAVVLAQYGQQVLATG